MNKAALLMLFGLGTTTYVACQAPLATPRQQVDRTTREMRPHAAIPGSPNGLAHVVELALGMRHTCAIVKDGAVYCWGAGRQGQLGTGSHDSSRVPSRVVGVTDAVSIDAGMDHTCALHRTGRISCWGNNHSAALGDGSKSERNSPVQVMDIDDATQISLGMETSCALRENGTVACWGRNLEQRVNVSGSEDEHMPKAIEGMAEVKQLEVGTLHICAIQGEEGQLVCVGLDHGINPPSGYQTVLSVESSGYDGVTDLAAGGAITCFEKDDKWRCWGHSYRGQLGLPGKEAVVAADAGPVPSLVDVNRIVAGDAGACAIDNAGGVYCWGYDDHSVVKMQGLEPVKDVVLSPSSYERHVCALTRAGRVVCWGDNDSGQLGDGTDSPREMPVLVVAAKSTEFVANAGKATPRGVPFIADQIAAGYDETCALKSDQVWCWGDRHNRVLSDPLRHRRSPERVSDIDDPVEIVAGFGFMCARLSSGAVRCWGENDKKQLGDGTDRRRMKVVAVKGVTDAVQLVADYGRGCVLSKMGDVICWGNHEMARAVERAAPWRGKIESVSLSEGNLCLLLKTGNVVCQGSNAFGQLGNGRGGCKPDPRDCHRLRNSRCKQREICEGSEEFVAVKGLQGVKAVSLGSGFGCALVGSGKMWCWGRGSFGRLGIGPADSSMEKLPVELKGLSNVTEMAASSGHACARVSSGRVYCWGQNVFGQLGDRTTQTRIRPSQVFGIDDARSVSTGMSHGCVLRNNGQVWCWGENDGGNLGVGDEERFHLVAAPVLVLE